MSVFKVQTETATVIFEVLTDRRVVITRINSNNLSDADIELKRHMQICEVQITGNNFHHKGVNFVDTSPGSELKYSNHKIEENNFGKLLIIKQHDELKSIEVSNYYQLYDKTSLIRSWVEVTNTSEEHIGIEYVSSFAISGINQFDDLSGNYAEHNEIYVANNNWTSEAQWKKQSLKDVGLDYWVDGEKGQASTKRISINNNSSWSCSEYSPNGILTNTKTGQSAIWQIENNGAWHYELTDIGKGNLLALRLSGPEEIDNSWWKNLLPGESFKTCTVAFSQLNGDFEDAIDELTEYRRLIRRPNRDNKNLAVIFNDYMNGLAGDPTTAKEKSLADAAAKVGCEYFVIDCGWYAPGYWWDSVGEWLPSKERFPNGIEELIKYIRDKGMTPGLWLEIEVIGIKSPIANKLPDDWFFMRHGKRVIDADRYHLDFRNPEVRKFADEVVDRLVEQYGVGYIKMDYNITTGIGTDLNSDSFGDGLLEHNREYIKWIKNVFNRFPELVIENCGSGGMRHDYALMEQHSIQSLTDQTDYVRNGNIASVGATVVTPEQCAVWSYPLKNGDEEEVIYNMTNTMLMRIHQSGLLDQIKGKRLELVTEGIQVYKGFRDKIPDMLPIWPSGLNQLDDQWFSYGLKGNKEIYLAIWRGVSTSDNFEIDLSKYGNIKKVEQIYPVKVVSDATCINKGNVVNIEFKNDKMARLYHIKLK